LTPVREGQMPQLKSDVSELSYGELCPSFATVSAVEKYSSSRFSVPPLFSNRQHLSYDGCLEVSRDIIKTVLCCIVY